MQNGMSFDIEQLRIIRLSSVEAEYVEEEIKKNNNWNKSKINETLLECIQNNTRENIFNKIPKIENYYWTFYNWDNFINDERSIEEMLKKDIISYQSEYMTLIIKFSITMYMEDNNYIIN